MPLTETQAGLVNSGVAAGSSLATGIINGFLQSRENKRNRQFAKEQADIAYQRQRTLIDEQRNYDSISSQMQRYIEAGLNPNLVLGNVTAPGSPVQAPMAESPRGLAPQIQNPYGAAMNAALTAAQIRRLDTQNSNDTRMTGAQITRLAHENNVSVAHVRQVDAQIELWKVDCDEMRQSMENMKAQIGVYNSQENLNNRTAEFYEAKSAKEAIENEILRLTKDTTIAATNRQNEVVIKYAFAMAAARLLNLKADTSEKNASAYRQGSEASLNNQLYEFKLHMNPKEIVKAEKMIDYVTSQIKGQNLSNDALAAQIFQIEDYNSRVLGNNFTAALNDMFKMFGQLFSFGYFPK